MKNFWQITATQWICSIIIAQFFWTVFLPLEILVSNVSRRLVVDQIDRLPIQLQYRLAPG